jgi:hypothetical protein
MSSEVAQKVMLLDGATRAGTIPAGTLLYLGVRDYNDLGWSDPLQAVKDQGSFCYHGFLSTTTSRAIAIVWSRGGSRAVLLELKITKNLPGVHLGQALGQPDPEQEILLPRNTDWTLVGYHREAIDGRCMDIVTAEPAT